MIVPYSKYYDVNDPCGRFVPLVPSRDAVKWCDQRLTDVELRGVDVVDGIYMHPVEPGGVDVGQCIGRQYHLESSEIRAQIVKEEAAFQMSSGFTVEPDSWFEGTGPLPTLYPLGIDIPPTFAPPISQQKGVPPMRLIVAVDRQPRGLVPPDLDQVLDFSVVGNASGMCAPLNKNNQERFLVVHDETININSRVAEYQLSRTVDWIKIFGKPVTVTLKSSGEEPDYQGVASNACVMWLICPDVVSDTTAVILTVRSYYTDK